MKKTIILLFILKSSIAFTQVFLLDTSLIEMFDTANNFYKIKNTIQLANTDIVNIGSSNRLKVSNFNTFAIKSIDTNDVGLIHYDYKQFYKGILVDGVVLKIHSNAQNNVVSVNGDFINISNIGIIPAFNNDSAIVFAKAQFPNSVFAWEDSLSEQAIKLVNEDSLATNFPTATLVVYKGVNGNHLAYKIDIQIANPYSSWLVYIDAMTGILIKKKSQIRNCFKSTCNINSRVSIGTNSLEVPKPLILSSCGGSYLGQGATLYYGNKYFTTQEYRPTPLSLCKFRLKNTVKKLYVMNYNSNSPIDYKDNTNNWTTSSDVEGVTALWCLEKTYDFYKNTYNRNSYNDSYAEIKLFSNGPFAYDPNTYTSYSAAFWSNNTSTNTQYISISGGDAFSGNTANNDLTSLDIIGHEFTHGVNDFEADLVYESESGALDESFADIFGTMVEYYAKGVHPDISSGNYLCGEDMWIAGALRNLANPNQYNQPDTYGGQFWFNQVGCIPNSNNDFCGVHTNSGVQNYWFYLLAEGGTGTNDIGNLYCVSAIGREKAARIAYESLTNHLTQSSEYVNARFFSIQAAEDLYGINSNEVAQVTAAWYAVGVGAQYNGNIDIKNITINTPQSYQYNNKVVIENVTTNAPANLLVSSNTEIALIGETSFNSGSENALYIAPACIGGARMANFNGVKSNSLNSVLGENSNVNSLEVEVNINTEKISIAPNPSTGVFKINGLDNTKTQQIAVYSLTGKQVFSTSANNTETVIDISHLSNGLYFMHINQQRFKIIIAK